MIDEHKKFISLFRRAAIFATFVFGVMPAKQAAAEGLSKWKQLAESLTHKSALQRAKGSVIKVTERIDYYYPAKLAGHDFPKTELPPLPKPTFYNGTGFAAFGEDTIVTAYHLCTTDETDLRTITLGSGKPVLLNMRVSISVEAKGKNLQGNIIGGSEDEDTLFLRIHPDRPLQQIPIGNSEKLGIGYRIYAYGYPGGRKFHAIKGKISDPYFIMEDSDGSEGNVIEFAGRIAPGSSGGPILNLAGKVVGVQIAYNDKTKIKYGYATPSNTLSAIYKELKSADARTALLQKKNRRHHAKVTL